MSDQMTTIQVPAALRPVTPVGILAQRLAGAVETAELLDRVMGEHGVAGELINELRSIWELAVGFEPYVEACTTPESEALAALARSTRAADWNESLLEAEMLSGPVEAQFLRFLVAMSGATQVLEVGMFTGYSALAMAEAMGPGGRLVACELDTGVAEIARAAFQTAGCGSRIEVRLGAAEQTLAELAAAGERFELVFVDADKAGYAGYLSQILEGGLLSESGTIVVDNTLMQGQPWASPGDVDAENPNGPAIAAFNAAVVADERLEQVLVPLRDGITLIRRRR